MAYEVIDSTPWTDGRNGPRLDKFHDALSTMKVDQAIKIPLVENAAKKLVPETGFNLKAANEVYAPKVFAKRRYDTYVKVQRIK